VKEAFTFISASFALIMLLVEIFLIARIFFKITERSDSRVYYAFKCLSEPFVIPIRALIGGLPLVRGAAIDIPYAVAIALAAFLRCCFISNL
jgi:uncharacterized protein YggT (Ycf19 family)